MNQPFASGDLLGLRVFPRTDFGGHVSVWHRDPGGSWAQYVDRAPVAAGCPRVWGPALDAAAPARIELTWVAPAQLDVVMDEPALRWQLAFARTPLLAALNAVHAVAPLATWRPRALVALREQVARRLGLGATAMSGPVPSGEHLVAVMRRMFWVRSTRARLRGRDLGEPVTLAECPTIGGWPLPRRGVLAIGEAHVTTGDREEYSRLRRTSLASRDRGTAASTVGGESDGTRRARRASAR